MGREGLRVREHNTRQLIAPVVFFCFVFFIPLWRGVGSGFVQERDLVREMHIHYLPKPV